MASSEITVMQVISDAVKIGLGALIASIGAWVNSAKTHSQRNKEEYTKRRRDALEELMGELNPLIRGMMNLAAHVLLACKGDADKPDEKMYEIDKSKFNWQSSGEEIRQYNDGCNAIEARIILIGFKEISGHVEDFREAFLALAKTEKANKFMVTTAMADLNDKRELVLETFSRAYKDA